MKNPSANLTLEPWNIPLAERMRALSKESSKKRVLYLYENPDTSTFRYRVYNIFQALLSSAFWQGSYFFNDELEHLNACLETVTLIVIVRFRWSFQLDRLILQAKKLNVPLVFDVDDLVFDTKKIPLLMNSLGVPHTEDRYAYWFSYVSRLTHTAQLCDATLSTNDFISSRLHSKFEKPSFIIPNFLNQEQLHRSEGLYKDKIQTKKSSGKFTIGYFSGTPSHKNDFTKALPEVIEFLRSYPQASLEVVGFMEFPDYVQYFLDNKQIYHTPLVDFLTLQNKIAHVDVNIVPLMDNEFTNCKSELKFFEAAIVGTPTCATPVHVFKENIIHEKSGYLCEEGQWFKALEDIYEGRMDPDLNASAKEYCINKYAFYNQTSLIENVFNQLTPN